MPWRQLRLGCHPPELFDRLKTLPSFSARELALDMTLEEKAVEGCDESEFAEWVELHTRREQRWFDVATYLMREEPADLVGIVFDGVENSSISAGASSIQPRVRPSPQTGIANQ